MKAIRLAISLILVPRLFLTLILLPLVLSIVLVVIQLSLTRGAVYVMHRDSKTIEEHFNNGHNFNLMRKMLYGVGAPLPEFKVCRWTFTKSESGEDIELPPEGCELQRLNVVINPENISQARLDRYIEIFRGNTKKLHICKSCISDLVINFQDGETKSSMYSMWGVLIASLAKNNFEVTRQYIKAVKASETLKQLLGDQYIFFEGLTGHIRIAELESKLVMILNIAGILIVAAWLALKAHKKILDYFAKSGALLPLVAATGKETFYKALWLITCIRVSAFLVTALPITIYTIVEIYSKRVKIEILDNNWLMTGIWFATLFIALSFATLIASISDLKQRYSILGVLYKFVPMALCLFGILVWSLTFLIEGHQIQYIRYVATSLPIIGLGPIMVTPIVKPAVTALAIHLIGTLTLIKILLSRNSRWFAAHLEDI